MLKIFLFDDALEVGERSENNDSFDIVRHQSSLSFERETLFLEEIGEDPKNQVPIPPIPTLPPLVCASPSSSSSSGRSLPPPGMTRMDGDERYRPLAVLRIRPIAPELWAKWTVVFSVLFVVDAVVVVILSALALSMIRPRLSRRCFDVPLRYTANYTNMAYGAFSAFFSTALLFMVILIHKKNG
jgi:hypothetical protein